MSEQLGGKISAMIPKSRIPDEVMSAELERVHQALPHVHLQQRLTRGEVERLKEDYDFVVIAVGAQKPRRLPIPGAERMIPALDFLRLSKRDEARVGKGVVIVGAGNVGCDAATEAHRLGAVEITLIDIQEPLSSGRERRAAEAAGAKFRWPCFAKGVTAIGLELTTGEIIPADTVIVSIGDQPDLDFLPETVTTSKGFIEVNESQQTSDPQIFAIGDAVKLGLLTDAIGAGRRAAQAIGGLLAGEPPQGTARPMIDRHRMKLEYFDPRLRTIEGLGQCASACSSCGSCRECDICITVCPQGAISKRENGGGNFEMVVNGELCIGCGFCAGACPCGIWTLVENEPVAM
jgi:NADPH-dependent 2,4-dienoyl-CoA reductase/sulfur reductase-like enzyme/NAD-dependent dihydropyrimidine dehydrogenase PreA subunit